MKSIFCFLGKHLWKMAHTGKPYLAGDDESDMFTRDCVRCGKKQINKVDEYGVWYWETPHWLL